MDAPLSPKGNGGPPEDDRDRRAGAIAQAISSLWECAALYEPGHPSFDHALRDCCRATAHVREPIVFSVTDSGLELLDSDGHTVGSGLASALRRHSIVGLSVHGRLHSGRGMQGHRARGIRRVRL